MYRPVVFAAGMLIAGIVLSKDMFPVILMVIIIYSYYINKGKANNLQFIIIFSFYILALTSIYYLGIRLGSKPPKPLESFLAENDSKQFYVEGKVKDLIKNQKGQRLTVSVSFLSSDENKKSFSEGEIFVYTEDSEASVNDTIVFVSEIEVYKKAYNEGGFDSKSYYDCRGIYGYAYPESIDTITAAKSGGVNYYLFKLREKAINNISKTFKPNDAGILIAILTGEKTFMVDEISEMYRNSGFAHVLAISGLHISLIGLTMFKLLRKKKISFIPSTVFTLLVLCIYDSFSGGQVSCKRAIIMLCVSLISRCLGKRYDMLTALAVSAIIILINQPKYVYDSSFIMSYSAALGISTFGQVLNKAEIFEEKKVMKAIKSVLFSVSVQVAILPSQIEFFNTFCPYSLLVNLFLLPLISIPVVSGIVSIILACFSSELASLTAIPAKLVLLLYESALEITGKLPMSEIVTGHMTKWKWGVVCIIITMFLLLLKYGREIYSFWCLVSAVFLLVPYHDGSLKISTLYVGQGDCHIITYKDYAIIIDCGSSDEDELYRYTVEPYLRYNGYDRPDYVFLSHTDEDHVSGLVEYLAMEESGVTVFVPKLSQKDFHAVLMNESTSKTNTGCELVEIACGSSATLDELELICIYPDEDNNAYSQNETSMVLLLEYNDFSMLFTGDVSGTYEDTIAENVLKYGGEQEIDVLKVSHHGSKYSTNESFLEILKPTHAVISCGIDNMYNHPADELIERLEKAKIEYFITTQKGQIIIECDDKSNYNILTFQD